MVVLGWAISWNLPAPVSAQAADMSACESESWDPGTLALDAYLDSALVTTALQAQWNPEWGRVIATFGHDTTQVGDRVWIGTSASDVQGLDRVAAWLVQARRDVPLTEAQPELTILVGDGGEFALRSVDFESCEPALSNDTEVADSLRNLRTELRSSYNDRQLDRMEARVRVRVSETGFPIDVQLVEPSGSVLFDEAIPGLIGRVARFEPGTMGGIPFATWTSLPVSFGPGDGPGVSAPRSRLR